MKCSSCQFENPSGFKFCGNCGSPIGQPNENAVSEPFRRTSYDGVAVERRQLTILFCDLVDSTRLSIRFDAEIMRDLIREYQTAAGEAVSRFGGYIAQFLGDGILVYFGYPVANENDAESAVLAGLGIINTIEELNSRINARFGTQLSVRIGIHTGDVVTGEIGSGETREQLAIGAAPNVAARLQGIATPGSVVISDTTARLVQNRFDLSDLGDQHLKGLSNPVHAFSVRKSQIRAATYPINSREIDTFVGRESEITALMDAWSEAKGSAARIVFIDGEAGSGKSRLVSRFQELIGQVDEYKLLSCQCSRYKTNTAFHPVIELIERAANLNEIEEPEARFRTLKTFLTTYDFRDETTIGILADLLSIPHGLETAELPPPATKAAILQVTQRLLDSVASVKPLLLIFEDVHWADQSTLELLDFDNIDPESRLLVILTCRAEINLSFDANSPRLPRVHLNVTPLLPDESKSLAHSLIGERSLPSEIIDTLIDRSDGNPLFLEELVRMVLESETKADAEDDTQWRRRARHYAIPMTLQDSLMARLDRLGTAKKTAQLASAIGRDFSFELLCHVATATREDLEEELRRLEAAELVQTVPRSGSYDYRFKHALVQDTAYRSILRRERRELHKKIGHSLTELFPDLIEAQPEEIARHFTEGGVYREAIPLWQRAGERDLGRSANVEACSHLNNSLNLIEKSLDELAESEKLQSATQHDATRDELERIEIEVDSGLAVALFSTEGATEKVAAICERARELCYRHGAHTNLAPILTGLWRYHIVHANITEAAQLADECLQSSQSVDDPTGLLYAHLAVGNTSFLRGEFRKTIDSMRRAESLCTPAHEQMFTTRYGYLPQVHALMYKAYAQWQVGEIRDAEGVIKRLLAYANSEQHPYSLQIALWAAACHAWHARDADAASEHATKLIELCARHHNLLFQGTGMLFHGWSQALKGDTAKGIDTIRFGFEEQLLRAGGRVSHSVYSVLLTEAYLLAEQYDDAESTLNNGIAFADEHGDYSYTPEMYRLKGNVSKKRDHHLEQAQVYYDRAMRAARHNSAAIFEMRAATDILKLDLNGETAANAVEVLTTLCGDLAGAADSIDVRESLQVLQQRTL